MSRHFPSLDAFLSKPDTALGKGPIAIVLAEDAVELASTLRHAQDRGFKSVLGLMPASFELPRDVASFVWRIDYDMGADDALETAVNRVNDAAPGAWVHYCYNAEYLFFPFCETRSVGELLAVHTEERRDSMLTLSLIHI